MSTTQQKTDAEILKENIQATAEVETVAAEVAAAQLRYSLKQTLRELEPQAELLDGIPVEFDFTSLGLACQIFGIPPELIRMLAQRAGARFHHANDGIPYFDGHAILAMHHHAQKLRAEYMQSVEANEND